MPTPNRQPTLFAKAVLVAAAIAAILGLLEAIRGLFSFDWAEIGHGIFLLVVAIGASWLFNNFGASKGN
jgi:hypothetical protein